ncbi:MAG: hypothetical protein PXZ07_03550 [Candidatus Eremiobacteraeota bacterium]|nr:hypothetical protein [Candidatus Eremiobacteraeota bacterium]
MIGLDTNVILRILTGDDQPQQLTTLAFLRANCSNEDPGWVNRSVTVEPAWVLERDYKFTNHDAIRSALVGNRKGGDLAGALLGEINRERTCTTTFTLLET